MFYAAEMDPEVRSEIADWLRSIDVDVSVVAGLGVCQDGIVVDEFALNEAGEKFLDPETGEVAYKGFRVIKEFLPEDLKARLFKRDA